MKKYGIKHHGRIIQHIDAAQATKEDLFHEYFDRHVDSISNAWHYDSLKAAKAEMERLGYEIVRIKFVEVQE